MKYLLEQMSEVVGEAFEAEGVDPALGRVVVSNRPDLCEFQCNGAMAAAKKLHRNPLEIAQAVAERLKDNPVFSSAEALRPGFLNMNVDAVKLGSFLNEMASSEKFGLHQAEKPEKIIVDYGGPNVAKPLHIGHLRAAIIGEAVKRMLRYEGHEVLGDIHMGDWGLQMGLIITELEERRGDLVYFDPDYEGEYPPGPPLP